MLHGKPGFFQTTVEAALGSTAVRKSNSVKESKKDEDDWGYIVAILIKHGHTWGDIQTYTIAQIKMFSNAINRIEEIQSARNIMDTAYGAQMSGDEINKKVSELLK